MDDFSKYLMKGGASPVSEESSPIFSFAEKVGWEHRNSSPLSPTNLAFEDEVFDEEYVTSSLHSDPILTTKVKSSYSIEEEIAELESDIELLHWQMRENEVKDLIYSKHVNKNAAFSRKIEEIVNRINENHERQEKKQINKSLYYAQDLRFQDGVSYTETACMRSVREICEAISSHFSKEFFNDNSSSGVASSEDEVLKQQIWTSVEDLVRKHHSSEIFEALTKNIQQSTDNLNELCSRIDLQRDAANLKLKFETGKLKDLSSGPALFKTVNELIEMGQVSHFQQFLASESSKNKAFEMKKHLKMCNSEIDRLLKEKLDPAQAAIMQRYLRAEQENSSTKASVNFLRDEMVRLKEEETEKEALKANIQSNYNKIQNFEREVQKKQAIIQNLVQVNGSAKSRHRQQQGDIVKLVEEKILQKKEEISNLYKKHREGVDEENSLFSKLPLQNVCSFKDSQGTEKLVSELSVNCTNPYFHNNGCDTLNHVLRKTNAPTHSAPEKLHDRIRAVHDEIYVHSEKIIEMEDKVKEVSDLHAKLDMVTEELGKVYKQQFQSLLPDIKLSEDRTTEIMGLSLKFQKMVQTWWQQPAQYEVPWERVDGFDVHEYNEKFAKQGELLKQLREGKNK